MLKRCGPKWKNTVGRCPRQRHDLWATSRMHCKPRGSELFNGFSVKDKQLKVFLFVLLNGSEPLAAARWAVRNLTRFVLYNAPLRSCTLISSTFLTSFWGNKITYFLLSDLFCPPPPHRRLAAWTYEAYVNLIGQAQIEQQHKAASAHPWKINNTLFVVDVKYQINERCPVSETVTLFLIHFFWMIVFCFYYSWVRWRELGRKKESGSLVTSTELHCRVSSWCIHWCSTIHEKCIQHIWFRGGVQYWFGILNAY